MKPFIDKSYPLEHMAEADARAEQGHKKGNVAITV
jgi:NADPH:quinone reductase-like Zn-dependent oxidoreductase